VIVEQGLAIPMRDGVVLHADVYRPEAEAPVPVLLLRTPYDRSRSLIPPSGVEPERATEAGFALVCQDVRGQYGSEGEFYSFVHEGGDGYDTVEWAAAQPWSSGAVGMVGRSYAGACQWLAAAERPPHLRALVPVVTGSDFFDGWIYQGGAFQLGFNLFWTHLMSDPRRASKISDAYRHLPLPDVPLPEPKWSRLYLDWLAHSTDDDYWQSLSIDRRYDRVEVPALNVGGWYDIFLGGTLENFARMREEGGAEAARDGQRLVVGPWAHGSTYGAYPDHGFDAFAPDDALDLAEVQLEWLARRLRGEAAVDDEPPVRIFVMGENRWRDEDAWPLARARAEAWYLRADGVLAREPPGDEAPDGYVYDPNDPAPTVGGPTSLPARMMRMNSGPLDNRKVEARDDVLVYTSEPLDAPLEVTGPLSLRLFAATTAPDTDFVAKLSDVQPDGASLILAESILRVRFRDGFERPRPVEPGEVLELTVDLVATSNVFLPGHRIRLAVTSSSFPRFDRNANTGRPLGEDGPDDLRPARQTVFHDHGRPSHLILPVVPR
jgi:putative CocE/NonD family hydrolase